MPILTEWQRYQRYRAWCLLLGANPATFERWRRETERIYENFVIDGYNGGVGLWQR